MEDKIRVNFNMDKTIHTRVRRLALDTGKTATELYIEWTLDGLQKAEKKQKKLNDYQISKKIVENVLN